MKNLKIKDWYLNQYPTDELGAEINPTVTFEKLFTSLINKVDVYDFLGVGDSLIRERCFEKLAENKNKPYEFIYNIWINKN